MKVALMLVVGGYLFLCFVFGSALVFLSRRGRRVRANFEWQPRDLWVGAFWRRCRWEAVVGGYDRELVAAREQCDIWVCLLPCLPLHIEVSRRVPKVVDLDAERRRRRLG